MRPKQAKPKHIRRKNKLYSPSALTSAYKLVKEDGVSVRKAAALTRVPESTLRDRTLGNVHPDTTSAGTAPLFDQFQEVKLVNHFKKMAAFGYGYTRQECVDIASDFAVQLGKRRKDKPLTMKWMRGFLKRWPELKVLKPKGLEFSRAKMASKEVVFNYFSNLKSTLEKHNLANKPHLIFNVDEKGISVEHKPPYIVAGSSYTPSAVTSGKGKTVTILGCGSAAGQAIPPYLVFPGQRMREELLHGASPGADGTISESGWSNSSIFRHYIENHFLKFAPGHNGQKILLILDGHKSHVSVGLSEWALQYGIIIFILPPHCSHILQPMDVGCFGPFQRIYDAQCHKLIRQSSTIITRYNICEVACQVYTKALSSENIQSSFRRSGIYPFSVDAVPKEKLLPAEVFQSESTDAINDADSQETVEGGIMVDQLRTEEDTITDLFEKKENDLKKVKSEHKSKQRKTMSKIVAGKEITEEIVAKMTEHEKNQKKPSQNKHDKLKSMKKDKVNVIVSEPLSPKPGPSHINLIPDTDTDDSMIDEDELCCQCKRYTPEEVSRSISIIFVKWGRCDNVMRGKTCNHWVHLSYCTPVRVLRRSDSFLCPCCDKEE
ncbi:uncharacterized protein LOC128551405 [Mercenaria mercenaria]|uniref:uncharacterized protein LOC128551405 n=1 Tax=Mercenaria mercenaria TaxID=6596 RepID=UPI00234E467D|nr:uncharacterized protein LOC128551405 [Mercenaria mercenaria]